jgi:hypothetical protein
MDSQQFDALARLVWTRKSRRAALAAVLGAALVGGKSDSGAAQTEPCLGSGICCGFDENECRARCCSNRLGRGVIACGGQFHCSLGL